jgi:hypothetical protein
MLGLSFIGDANANKENFQDAFKNHHIGVLQTGKVLELIYRENLSLYGSSTPTDSIAKLYDGVLGDLNDYKTFLSFEGPKVKLTMNVPFWRNIDNLSFTALEILDAPSKTSLIFKSSNNSKQKILLNRKIVKTIQDSESKKNVALVEYKTPNLIRLSNGILEINYFSNGLSKAHLGEFIVDNLILNNEKPKAENFIHDFEMWKDKVGKKECPKLKKLYDPLHLKPSYQKLKLLFGNAINKNPPKLLYWKKLKILKYNVSVNSLLIQVDNTGRAGLDFVEAWLVIPELKDQKIPLVLLPQQGHVYGGLESLGLMGEKELGLAGSLAEQGIASVSLNSFRFGKVRTYMIPPFFEKYPNSGTTAKDLENLYKTLDLVTDIKFQRNVGYQIDMERVGIWGFSYGAWISMLAGIMDERIKVVSFSSFHYYDKDIPFGFASALYIPQLICLNEWENPISVGKMLNEFKQDVLTTAPDAGLASTWQKTLKNDNVSVLINPFGHVVTEYERSEILNFFYEKFSINNTVNFEGPKHELPVDAKGMTPYIDRENRWRNALMKAMR